MDIMSGRVHAQLLTEGFSLPDELLELECAYIEAALHLSGGVVSRAALSLGVGRPALYAKTKRLEKWKTKRGGKKFLFFRENS